MNDIFQCGDSGALVAYLYDECSPGEHAVIAAHIKGCVTCASEINALSATRRTLAAWTPPDLALGFQLTRSDVTQAAKEPARVLTPKIAWWRAPLPAWAQAAAALVIFAAGLSVGFARTATVEQPAAASVSRDDLAQVERRIKTEVSQLRGATSPVAPVAARGSDEALIQQVKALIEESAAEERRKFTLRMVEFGYAVEKARREDLALYGQVRGETNQVRQQSDALYEQLRSMVSQSTR